MLISRNCILNIQYDLLGLENIETHQFMTNFE